MYESLTPMEGEDLRTRLLRKLGIEHEIERATLLKLIDEIAEPLEGSAEAEGFDLGSVLAALQIRPRVDVYINWYRFDSIDRMAFADLRRFFDDIWYPASDDVEVFDESLSWILLISHEGGLSIAWPGRQK